MMTRPSFPSSLAVPAALTLVVGLATSCFDGTHEPAWLSIEPMPSPAGPGSAEPFLVSGPSGALMSWLEEAGDAGYRLRFSSFGAGGWSAPFTVAERDDFFVNWADFPSVTPAPDGALVAHWLQRGEQGGYDYGIRVVRSTDGGRSWGEPWKPHDDDTPTEHGFVAIVPVENEVGIAWLDGRRYAPGPDGRPASNEMTLRFRTFGPAGMPGPETLVDPRVCDCCQTDAAVTARGPVLVYRDRSPGEIRDIHVSRLVDGVWTPGRAVHEDGWEIAGCPVNGPAVAARGEEVAVAWFTAAGDEPRVKLAFSTDSGADFGVPVTIDDGNPVGRVDVLLHDDGRALVTWIEQVGPEHGEVRVRGARPDGTTTPSAAVARVSAGRASGFPRMTALAEGSILVAWTNASDTASRVEVARLHPKKP